MRLADFVLNELAKAGAGHVFLVPGGAAMHLNDALGRNEKLRWTATFHEYAATVAAECAAKLTGRIGVAMVTAGPGSTNAVSGVASAYVNSAPLVVLAGQVKRADLKAGPIRQLGLQEVDSVGVVGPITKWATTIRDPGTVRHDVERAVFEATSGRPGPVWLTIPQDVQAVDIDPAALEGFIRPRLAIDDALDHRLEDILGRLAKAERPIVLAGAGIRVAGAAGRFLELLEALGAPVQTTWVAVDLVPNAHPLFAGRPGAFASRGSNFAIQNSDFLLALGARLDFATIGFSRERFARGATRVAIDVDPAEIGKLGASVEIPIVAGADEVVERLLRLARRPVWRDRTGWLARIRAWDDRYPLVPAELRGLRDGTSTYVLVERLSEVLREKDVVVEGSSGIHAEIFFPVFAVKPGQRVLTDGSYGTMGYGLPAAIGASIASGRRRTILVEGDGSLQPNLQELETIAREKLPIKIVLVDNRGYSSIRSSQNRYFSRLIAADATSGLTFPPIEKIASAYGIPFYLVAREAELDGALRDGLDRDGPAIINVIVPPDEDRTPRLGNFQKPDGTMVSRPLEDLYPFLGRAELRSNLLIDPIPEE